MSGPQQPTRIEYRPAGTVGLDDAESGCCWATYDVESLPAAGGAIALFRVEDGRRWYRVRCSECGSPDEITPTGKLRAAVELGRLGGLKGGPARARKLSAARRSEIAKKAAAVRWSPRR